MASGMGFSWGTSLLNANKDLTTTTTTTTTTNTTVTNPSVVTCSIPVSNTKHRKRSFQNDVNDENYGFDTNSSVNNISKSNIASLKMPTGAAVSTTTTTPATTKRKYTYNSTHQIMNSHSSSSNNNNNNSSSTSGKNPLLISQNLPLSRSLNLLSKDQLCELIQNMVQEQPELTIPLQNSINQKLSSTVTIQDFIDDLEIKFNKIIKSIPYHKKYYDMDKLRPFNTNCEYRIMDLDDYSFSRLKPYILDFLNCLIDYILFNLPPLIRNFIESIKLLDSITLMCLNLPRFKLPSNNYYYDKCWEQISFIWCSFINELSNNPILLNINDNNDSILLNWFHKLNNYNQLTNGMLNRPLGLIGDLLLHNRNSKDYNLLMSLLQQQQQQETNKALLSSAFTTNNTHQAFTSIHNFATITEPRATTNTLTSSNNGKNNYVYSSSTLENSKR